MASHTELEGKENVGLGYSFKAGVSALLKVTGGTAIGK